MTDRLVFIVEGDCEVAFVKKMLIPFLYMNADAAGWHLSVQKITTNRKLNKKGGNVSYALFKNEVKRVIAQGDVWITTFVDFFRLPNDFPGFTDEGKRIDEVEKAVKADIGYDRFLPYIQKFEFETLLFSSIDGFELLLDDDKKLEKIKDIINLYPDIESINGGRDTAPSKRLQNIFDYNKTVDSDMILSMLDIETIRHKCNRFNSWIECLQNIISGKY